MLADRREGAPGSTTPLTFVISRSGILSGSSTARWSVVAAGTGAAFAKQDDFASGTSSVNLNFPSGTVSFAALETSRTITVAVQGDASGESDETFKVSLTAVSGCVVEASASSASGTIRNDDIIGTLSVDNRQGTAFDDLIDLDAAQDTLTGLDGADIFQFRFGQSPLLTPDRVTDFVVASDRIRLLSTAGAFVQPSSLTRSADNSTASSLDTLVAALFKDADGNAQNGDQPLAANGAVVVIASQLPIAGTYLLVNNGLLTRSNTEDLLINLTGITGDLSSVTASSLFSSV